MNTIESNVAMRRVSRVLQWVGGFTSRSSVAATIAVVMLAFLVSMSIAGFPNRWQTGMSTTAESITLVMLFVIQHTQSRQQIALQLKLDELIRSSPHADDHLVHIELAADAELIEREQGQVAHHESLREALTTDE
ncbi:MAG: hypothetical protein HKL85_07065 [Acidimicrobiaceae bacterium]|nr:hypothetical protein [Acidimicrobiaceae bacterium]